MAGLAQSIECLTEERDENAVPYYFCATYINCKIKCFFSVFGLNGFKLAVSRCRENNEQNAHVCRI